MYTTDRSEYETIHLQECGPEVAEETTRSAFEILAEQSEEEHRPALFVP